MGACQVAGAKRPRPEPHGRSQGPGYPTKVAMSSPVIMQRILAAVASRRADTSRSGEHPMSGSSAPDGREPEAMAARMHWTEPRDWAMRYESSSVNEAQGLIPGGRTTIAGHERGDQRRSVEIGSSRCHGSRAKEAYMVSVRSGPSGEAAGSPEIRRSKLRWAYGHDHELSIRAGGLGLRRYAVSADRVTQIK